MRKGQPTLRQRDEKNQRNLEESYYSESQDANARTEPNSRHGNRATPEARSPVASVFQKTQTETDLLHLGPSREKEGVFQQHRKRTKMHLHVLIAANLGFPRKRKPTEEADRRDDQVRQIVAIHQRIKAERQAKGTKEEETTKKDKPLAILTIQPWERAPARNKKPDDPSYHITQRIQWRNHLADSPDIPTSKDRTGIRKIRVVPSTALGMLKFPVKGGTVTIRSSRVIPMECAMISGPSTQHPVTSQVLEEKIKVAIHPEYPEQTIAIGSTLIEKGRKELCALLRQNLDVFAWKPTYMTGVPQHMAEHRLNVREGCPPFRQKKRGKAPKRNKAIQEEVEKLVDAGIMKEVHYHSWLSNPVMVKKHDGSWRMCVDFKNLNKACPQV
ncbi:hypothetical protein Tco_0086774 [Tanacetum coccineum]